MPAYENLGVATNMTRPTNTPRLGLTEFLRTPRGRVLGIVLATVLVTVSLLLINSRLMFSKASESTMSLSLSKPKVDMELAERRPDSGVDVTFSAIVRHEDGIQVPQEIPVFLSFRDEEDRVVKDVTMPVAYDDLTVFPCLASAEVTLSQADCDAIVTVKAKVDDEHIELDTTPMEGEAPQAVSDAKAELAEDRARGGSAVTGQPVAQELVPKFSDTDFSDTFVIGDSVLALSAREGGYGDKIAEHLPGAEYDVESGRYFESDVTGDPSDGMIDIARDVAGKYDRYVIECGINDAGLTGEMAHEFLDVLMRDGVQIYFVNQRVIGGADDTTCSTIRDVAGENDRVYEIDWNNLCSGNEDEWLLDVCHPNEVGADRLTSLIRDVVAGHAGDIMVPAPADGQGAVNPVPDGGAGMDDEARIMAWHDSEDISRADLRISTDAEISAWGRRIDAYLEGSELAGHGRLFAECAARYQVDPRLSPAISTIESGKGSVCVASHNAWGWGGPGNWASWSSWEEAIEGHVSGLASGGYASMGAEECARYCDWGYWDGDPGFCLKTEVLKI